jgi:hypothetical protein
MGATCAFLNVLEVTASIILWHIPCRVIVDRGRATLFERPSGAMAAEHIDRSVMGDRRSLGWVDGRSVMRPVPSVARVTSVYGPAGRCR